MAKDWRLWILVSYAAVTIAAMVHMGQPDELDWFLLSIPFLLWALVPLALLCLIRLRPGLLGIGAGICALFGVWIYVDTAWIPPSDAQDGLIFLFLPLLQLGFAGIWIVGVLTYDRFIAKGS